MMPPQIPLTFQTVSQPASSPSPSPWAIGLMTFDSCVYIPCCVRLCLDSMRRCFGISNGNGIPLLYDHFDEPFILFRSILDQSTLKSAQGALLPSPLSCYVSAQAKNDMISN